MPYHRPDHAYTVNRTCRGYMDAESLYGNMCVVQCLLQEGPVTFCGHSKYINYIKRVHAYFSTIFNVLLRFGELWEL